MVFGALLFVLGFTVVFVAQGIVFGQLGGTINEHRLTIERVLGVVTIVMGVVFLGAIPSLQREWRVHRLPRPGLLGAPLLGLVFGLAWAPCLTPTLGAVNSLAYTQGTAGRGAFLQVFYCLGLGIPFILVAVGFGWVAGALAFVRKHRRVISQAGGVVLIARDSCFRDIASMHGTYRKVEETSAALELVGRSLASRDIASVTWLLDKPVSNSGRLASIIRELAGARGWKWEVEIVFNPDAVLSESPHVVATADSGILDRSVNWLSLARLVVCEHVPDAKIVDVSGHSM